MGKLISFLKCIWARLWPPWKNECHTNKEKCLANIRPTTELFSLDSSFVWQAPLTVSKFEEACERRGFHLSGWWELEAFHRAKALVPFFRFEANESSRPVGELDFSSYLHGFEDVGIPSDPRREDFKSWSNYIQSHEYGQEWTCRFLYSPYQLLLIPDLRSIRKYIKSQKTTTRAYALERVFYLEVPEDRQPRMVEEAGKNDELAVMLTAIETKYLPQIFNTITLHRDGEIETWLRTCHSIDPAALLNWLGLEAEHIKKEAERLLWRARGLDPLSEWVDLVRLCHSEKWKELRGDALIAMDHRIAAEILLLFYEDLVKVGLAEPLEPDPKYLKGKYHGRLRPDDSDLDSVLMDFGISPQPSLLLVLEGKTEKLIVPRVMKQLRIPSHSNFIELFNGGGVDQHYALLASYISAPKLGQPIRNGMILRRPPTRFLIAFDPEGAFATPDKCEKRRRSCINNIYDAMPKEYKTDKLRGDIDSLVEIQTWNDKLESFEFAHFTDKELAEAILSVYEGGEVHSLSDVEARIANVRMKAGNIEYIWKEWKGTPAQLPTKMRLAEALWPLLEKKIEEAISADSHKDIPVVRVLIHAVELAQKLPRRSVMIRM
jgi:hypothetical protein